MTTPLTPPPADAASRPPIPPAQRRGSGRVIAIIAIVAGALLILGAVAVGILSVVRSATVSTDDYTADATGAGAVAIDVGAVDLDIAYRDVDEATLEVTGPGAGSWQLERLDDTLVVNSDRAWWNTWSLFGGGGDTATLVLPDATPLDTSIELGAGSVRADGSFGTLRLELGAGQIVVGGSADELVAHVNAGRIVADVSGVTRAGISVNAGSFEGDLTGGPAPDELDVEVNAGRAVIALPDESYRVVSDVSAGSFDNRLVSDPNATRSVTVNVSAGEVVLRTGS